MRLLVQFKFLHENVLLLIILGCFGFSAYVTFCYLSINIKTTYELEQRE
jgi:hypothetical protein